MNNQIRSAKSCIKGIKLSIVIKLEIVILKLRTVSKLKKMKSRKSRKKSWS